MRIYFQRENAWSSWNYLLGSENDTKVTLTYNMNILQNLNANKTFCVTLNNCEQIDKNKIIKEIVYHHPLFTAETIKSQSKKDLIDGHINTYFCGAYWSNGFHEDGVKVLLMFAKNLESSLSNKNYHILWNSKTQQVYTI